MNIFRILSRFTELPQNRLLQYQIAVLYKKRNCSTKAQVEDADYEENIKNKILKASLVFVKEHGWSKKAIEHGAESLGYPGVAHGLFPSCGAQLVQYFTKDCNQILAEKMKKDVEEKKLQEVGPIKFAEGAIETRLRMILPYKDSWPQAMAIMTHPANVPKALANLLTLVDDICYHAGDRSVDFYWYSRRIALATMYKATELYLLQDTSPDHQDTWTFLATRLDELKKLQEDLADSEKAISMSKDVFLSAFTTARNIMGLSR